MRANVIGKRLGILEASKTVLDDAAFAVVFLDDSGKCIYSNRAAEDVFQSNDGLCLRYGRLYSTKTSTNAALERAFREALSPVRSIGAREAVRVERRSMRRAYQVILAPLPPEFQEGSSAPKVVVMIADPEQQSGLEKTLLTQLYGLTSKEAEIANKLCQGKPIEEIAEELNIAYETARTHLRRIFS